jgi:hypothetical protein
VSDTTHPTTWGTTLRLVRCVYECMPITVEHGPRDDLANSPTSRCYRLLRHGIEEVLA